MSRFFPPAHSAICALALAGASTLSVQAHAQQAAQTFAIPAQPLSAAIQAVAQQSGIQILYVDSIPASLNAPALTGQHTPRQALERLLQGSSLRVDSSDERIFTIAPARDTATVSQLSAVHVHGQQDVFDVRPGLVTTATRTALNPMDIPQTLDFVDTQRAKDYGINELSTMLAGIPNIDTQPDMRADSIMIRGFEASSNDIYLDGIRASGQIRHSTANIERVEVLKGPASVLYGRGSGGGIVNQISKQARFDLGSSVTLRGGSWQTAGGTLDINEVVHPNIAVRLTADAENGHSFRDDIRYRNRMVSPSILFDNHDNFSWLLQYTHDEAWRVPDRGLAYDNLPSGLSIRRAFAHPDDYAEDRLRYFRSDMKYAFNDNWALRWVVGHRKQSQNFDHLYSGFFCSADGVNQTSGASCSQPAALQGRDTLQGRLRAWQQTDNTTLTTNLDLTGQFELAGMAHDLLVGLDYSHEQRRPSLATQRGLIDPIDIDNPVWLPKPPQGTATQENRHQAHARAIYLQDLISLTPEWKVLLGLRTEQFRFRSRNQLSGQSRSYEGTTTSPRIGLIWQPVPEHSLYVSYGKTFTPYGGSGLLSVSVDQTAVYNTDPEYTRQYETGLKSEWLDGNLSTQLSLFQLERYNIRYRPDSINEPDRWEVAGKERTQGMEFSLSGRIATNWYVRGGIGLQSAKVVEDASSPDRENQYKSGTGRRNGSLFLTYAPQTGFFAETGLTYVDARWIDIPNTEKLPGYTRWDAMIGWREAAWQASLAVTNLADREYWRSTSMPGQPRTVLATMTYRF
ncbi:MAG: TonB-dependent receptor [Corticimicrobacter sp.]|uniref:TonB-dependent receptor n=1 Tax=Corticimicrobacter sp. TaxID=2678536 RepID=UPI0032D9D22F